MWGIRYKLMASFSSQGIFEGLWCPGGYICGIKRRMSSKASFEYPVFGVNLSSCHPFGSKTTLAKKQTLEEDHLASGTEWGCLWIL